MTKACVHSGFGDRPPQIGGPDQTTPREVQLAHQKVVVRGRPDVAAKGGLQLSRADTEQAGDLVHTAQAAGVAVDALHRAGSRGVAGDRTHAAVRHPIRTLCRQLTQPGEQLPRRASTQPASRRATARVTGSSNSAAPSRAHPASTVSR